MSRTPRSVANLRPRVVVIGNHKGGSGKTTLAMHIAVALLKEGKCVSCFDMDRRQQTLSRYIENRREWAAYRGIALELPHHCAVAAAKGGNERAIVRNFIDRLKEVQQDFDFVIIDTPAGDDHLSLLAHGIADILLTPLNDSFIDLDAILRVGPTKDCEPGCYAQTVAAARRGRSRVSSTGIDWIIVRNRLGPATGSIDHAVGEVLEHQAAKMGYRTAPGLSERLVFRAFFPIGATAFDMLAPADLGGQPLIGQVLARMEVRQLLEAVGLLPATAEADGEGQHRPAVARSGDPAVAIAAP